MLNHEVLLTLKLDQQLFTDPRRIALLKAIQSTGSLSKAAKTIGISYKTAWDNVNEINQLAKMPFVISAAGGKGGGRTTLSAYAERFILLYDLLTQMQQNAFNILSQEDVALNDILSATARLSLQSSARNQLYGTIKQIQHDDVIGTITVQLSDKQTQIDVAITASSIKRLQLVQNKAVILLVKAPQIELQPPIHHQQNRYQATISHIHHQDQHCELILALNSGLVLYAVEQIAQSTQLKFATNQVIDIAINPENIILTTLV